MYRKRLKETGIIIDKYGYSWQRQGIHRYPELPSSGILQWVSKVMLVSCVVIALMVVGRGATQADALSVSLASSSGEVSYGAFEAPPAPPGSISAGSAVSPYSTGSATATNDGTLVNGSGAGAVTVAQYPSPGSFSGTSGPGGSSTFSGATAYFWIGLATGSAFTSLTISNCNLDGGSSLSWWNGTSWQVVSTANYSPGSTPCVNATLLPSGTSPTIAQLTGTVFAVTISRNAPYIDSITPSSSPLEGGEQAIITGTNFQPGATVSFGSVVLTSSAVTVQSATSIAVTVPPSLSPGMLPVTVTTSNGSGNTAEFLYVSASMSYVPLVPYRVADTRCGVGIEPNYCSLENLPPANQGLSSPPAGDPITVQITGVGPTGGSVTPTAEAIVVNVTAVVSPQANSGYLSVFPAGTNTPMASSINFSPGEIVPNLVTVALGEGGAISILSSSSGVNVIVDVEGYYAPGQSPAISGSGTFEPLSKPARLVDTRCTMHPQPSFCAGENLPSLNAQLGALAGSSTLNATIAGVDGVPISATAVSLVVTAASPAANGYLTVWPDGSNQAETSDVNFTEHSSSANSVIVPVGSNGQVSVYNGSGEPTDVVVDITGYFTDGGEGLTPSSPVRICDTRSVSSIGNGDVASGVVGQCQNSGTPVTPSSSLTLQVSGVGGVPTDADVVVVNITVIGTSGSGSGYLTAWPAGTSRPATSNINWSAGQVMPGMVVCALGPSGQMDIYTSTSANVVVDITGWYS